MQWSDLQYSYFQYESGLAYLRHYITHDQWGQDMLQRSKLFWNWWKNQWLLRDEAFIHEYHEELINIQLVTRCSLYYDLHDAAKLASDIYPNKTVLDESYCLMIHNLHKEELYV